ncbi:S41 family peptidase [Rhodoflexus caldus]|uniref:S41 family peptidase n=1 Tax=Rhodoflexus caldus TaxID=2891236 RepID=UPI002029C72F|nr:S41 family peptidase [Rhodoflexus caldus]
MSDSRYSQLMVRVPVFIALAICAGIFIGAKMFGSHSGKSTGDVINNSNKLREILNYIDKYYVDSANTNDLTDYAIKRMLEKLDPHTVYIPAKDMKIMGNQLKSHFEGIGVQFTILRDTLQVELPLAGGPAEAAGIRAGDKIVYVNGERIAGIGLTNRMVYDKLLGKKGSQVNLAIVRKGFRDTLSYVLTRDKIPQYSLEVAYMIADKTGYIRLARFGESAYDEFKVALEKLTAQGMKQLIFDLRGNSGGYMDRAVKIADEFIGGDKLLVYTDGRDDSQDEQFHAYRNGLFEKGAVILLINEESASASEIVAGALQDNDRALLVGRRSFGKGLVQRPIMLSDGSELRLTISRYYTPSGRSIQKPYEDGKAEQYADDFSRRLAHGELFVADSNRFDEKLKYKTALGRTVYGGGGIMPDVFVPSDTSYQTPYLNSILSANLHREFTSNYIANHQASWKSKPLSVFLEQFNVSDAMLQSVIEAADKEKLTFNAAQWNKSKKYFTTLIKALIARGIYGEEGFYRVMNQQDKVVQKALTLFDVAGKIEKGEPVEIN